MLLSRDQLDLFRFEDLVRRADAAEPAAAGQTLREALELWRGPPLADLAYESFAQSAIARMEELRLTVVEKRVDVDLTLGRHVDLVGELEALVAEHPLRERLSAQLMLTLYRSGRQAEALTAYRAISHRLMDELGIQPSTQLRDLEQAILRQDPSLELAVAATPERSLLTVTLGGSDLESLLTIAEPLAQQPGRELVLLHLAEDHSELQQTTAALHARREELRATGVEVRAAAFSSSTPGQDAIRIAEELDCDLMLVKATGELLDDPVLSEILAGGPCDVAALVGGAPVHGPLLVPFVGAEHDWTAIELAAWLAGAWRVPLRLAGPLSSGRDSSRLLASASLAIQHTHGVAAEPLLLNPDPDRLLEATTEATLVVAGLSDRWQHEGLGTARRALAQAARTPVLLVRGGLRPSGLAPRETRTRFTWSVKPLSG